MSDLLDVRIKCACGHEPDWNDYGDRLACHRCKALMCRDCNMSGGGWCKPCVDRDAAQQAKRRVE